MANTLIQELEAFIRLSEQEYGPNAPVTRSLRRQLDAVTSPPLSAKATFHMGGRTHSGNMPVRRPRRTKGKTGQTKLAS